MRSGSQLLAAAILALLFVSGCSLLPEAPPSPARHDFGPMRADAAPLPWSEAEVTAPEWLQDSALHYRLLYANPTEIRAYTRDSWVAPPPELLANRLNGGPRTGSRRLTLKLRSFEQVFDRPGHARVVMAFHASLTPTQDGAPIAERDFRFESPTSTADAPGALSQFPVLIEKAMAALREWALQPLHSMEAGRIDGSPNLAGMAIQPTVR
ncbi:MAG: hypothetical protein ACKN9W_02615 [Methylococcus sp.]